MALSTVSRFVDHLNPNHNSVTQPNLSSSFFSTTKNTKLVQSVCRYLRRQTSSTPARSMASVSSNEILKLASFVIGEKETQVGFVRHGYIWPLKQVLNSSHNITAPHISDMIDVINHWHLLDKCIRLEGPGIKLEDVKLLAPIPRPCGTIMCIGKNYADHVKEMDTWKTAPGITLLSIPKHPIVFTKAPQSVIGLGPAIIYPKAITTQVDYETELAVIIGKAGRCIKREDAISHVFGGLKTWAVPQVIENMGSTLLVFIHFLL